MTFHENDISLLLELKKRNVWIEGNIIKVLKAEPGSDFEEYLNLANQRDRENRKKRLDITKQIQQQNKELIEQKEENERIGEELKLALENAEEAREEAERAKAVAEADLDILQKRTQFELVGTIVKVALWVIIGVGIVTTALYVVALFEGKDTQIIGSTWSNMFGILLTNAFSIIGTIMGVKYASERPNKNNN